MTERKDALGDQTERGEGFIYPQSRALLERACRVIPGGIYGHFGPPPCVPPEAYPFFSDWAEGARFRDVDGHEFIDYMCAYGPMILGYKNPVVDEAFRTQAAKSDTGTLAAPVMVELAEYLCELVPIADWAFFAKNGADVTNLAVMTARAATGRRKIIAIRGGYHGTTPWMQSPGHHGLIPDDWAHVIRIPWNDVNALKQALEENAGDVAGFISSPYHHPVFADNELPAPGYWDQVSQLLRKHDVVFIIDDVRAGFRLHLGGSNEWYGFKPDMICFSKAMGNGYPISALVGMESLRKDVGRVFHTGSFWFGAGPMAAALATLKELKRLNAPALLRKTGEKLLNGMVEVARSHGYNLKVSGEPSMPYLRITDDPTLTLHQYWCAECTRRGAYFTSHHNWFISTAHTDQEIRETLDICDAAFKAVKKRFGNGTAI